MIPVTGPIERLCRPKCEIKSVKSNNEKLILHISHSVIIKHSQYEQLKTNMIAGIPFARCHEARWHGTSATATARKQTPYFHQLNGEILQVIPNTPYLGVTLTTYLKFNIHLNKNIV